MSEVGKAGEGRGQKRGRQNPDDVAAGRYFGGLTPQEAGRRRAEAARREREARERRLEALAAGPRETIAAVFHEDPEELQSIIRRLRRKAAAGDLQASRELRAWLDQGLGRVEVASGKVATVDTLLSEIPREERAAMIARLRAELAQHGDNHDPSGADDDLTQRSDTA